MDIGISTESRLDQGSRPHSLVQQSPASVTSERRRIAIVGTSGHAKVVIDLLERIGGYTVVCLIDSFKRIGTELFGHRVSGTEDDIPAFVQAGFFDCAVIAIGDNWTRGEIAKRIRASSPVLEFPVLVHPSATVGKDVQFGAGSVVVAGVNINPGARIGEFCILNTRSSLDHDSRMGDFSSLAPAAVTGGNVTIGAYSAIAIGATVSHEVSVGEHTVVGAGSLVNKNVPPFVVAYGVPARVIRARQAGAPYLDVKPRSSSGRAIDKRAPAFAAVSGGLKLIPAASSEWDECMEQVDHDFYQTSDFHRLSEFAGEGEAWLAVLSGPGTRILWPFMLREVPCPKGGDSDLYDVTSVYGYSGPLVCRSGADPDFMDSALQSLHDFWNSIGVISVFTRFHPLLNSEVAQLLGAKRLGSTVAIDTTLSIDEIRGGYRRQLKQQIRRCVEANVHVQHDPEWRHLDDFISFYYETMLRNEALPYYFFSAEYIRRLKKALGERGRLVVASCNGSPASIALVIENKEIVNIHLLGNSRLFTKLAPSKLLFDEIACWAHNRGAKYVHLGGGRGNRSDDSLFRFKAEFSKLSFPFHVGRWILNQEAYTACHAKRMAEAASWGLALTPDYFPAYRSPLHNLEQSVDRGTAFG